MNNKEYFEVKRRDGNNLVHKFKLRATNKIEAIKEFSEGILTMLLNQAGQGKISHYDVDNPEDMLYANEDVSISGFYTQSGNTFIISDADLEEGIDYFHDNDVHFYTLIEE